MMSSKRGRGVKKCVKWGKRLASTDTLLLITVRKPNKVVDIDFFCLDDVYWVVVDLKDDIADIHHREYVLCSLLHQRSCYGIK